MESHDRLKEARRRIRNGTASDEDLQLNRDDQRTRDKASSKIYWMNTEEKERVESQAPGTVSPYLRTLVLKGLNGSIYSKEQVEELRSHIRELRTIADERMQEMADAKKRERDLAQANAELTGQVALLHGYLERLAARNNEKVRDA